MWWELLDRGVEAVIRPPASVPELLGAGYQVTLTTCGERAKLIRRFEAVTGVAMSLNTCEYPLTLGVVCWGRGLSPR